MPSAPVPVETPATYCERSSSTAYRTEWFPSALVEAIPELDRADARDAVSRASVKIASNATNSPTVISLSGTGTHFVALSWAASTTGGVGYNVFRGTAPGAEGMTPLNFSALSGTSFTDVNVASGATYNYVVHRTNSDPRILCASPYCLFAGSSRSGENAR
jgi:hypothetical protein